MEQERYRRQTQLQGFGPQGQQRLKQASVLVVGAGGLGCPVLQYLASMGVGRLGIVDGDVVEWSNLPRQILFGESDIGKPKATAAMENLKRNNTGISIKAYDHYLDNDKAIDLISNYELVVDCTDRLSARYLINDICVLLGKPFVYGALFRYEAQVSVFNYQDGPTYRCLFPKPPLPDSIPDCSDTGVLGITPGIAGLMQAQEVIKILCDLGDTLSGKILTYNGLKNSHELFGLRKRMSAWGMMPRSSEEIGSYDYVGFCEGIREPKSSSIKPEVLMEFLNDPTMALVDIREAHEEPKILGERSLQIPASDLISRASELGTANKVILYCQRGIRSGKAAVALARHLPQKKIYQLEGGVEKFVKTELND